MILNVDTRQTTHTTKDGTSHSFRPTGPLYIVDDKGGLHPVTETVARELKNPIEKIPRGGMSARLFIGLNVGDKPTYTTEQVIADTIKIRKRQKVLPDASFLTQRGVYTHGKGKASHLVKEDSVQIIIIDTVGTPEKTFIKQVQSLGKQLRADFKQNEVILEVQKSGVVQDVYAISKG